jgi:hypothetical protein
MNIRKQRKRKLKFIPRLIKYIDGVPRNNALYYRYYCCKECYFDWGRWFEDRHKYKHNAALSNYEGALKKYWKYVSDYEVDTGENNES